MKIYVEFMWVKQKYDITSEHSNTNLDIRLLSGIKFILSPQHCHSLC